MGGGDEEDPQREVERLERDLAAIDARWSTEGYQQRTSSKVLGDERATRRELTHRIARLRGLPPPLTPAAGTVALNIGGAWRPLTVVEAPQQRDGELPLAALDVDDAEEVPPPLSELEADVHRLLTDRSGQSPRSELSALTKRFRRTPGATRLLAAAWASAGYAEVAAKLLPARRLERFEVPLIENPLLTAAAELPDEITGLTATQTKVMRVLRECAPDSGPFVRASEVFGEVHAEHSSIDESTFTREVALLGHPSLRMLPLVAFQGFANRFSTTPVFTHVRLTTIGREVIDGTFPIPNFLANGASGQGACLWPMATSQLARATEALFVQSKWPYEFMSGFDFPDGTRSQTVGFLRSMSHGELTELFTGPVYEPMLGRDGQRSQLVIRAFPWPRTVADVLPALERLLADGLLDGVMGFIDESSADEVRLVVDIEHVAFLSQIEQKLRNCRLFDARYRVEPRVHTTGPGQHPVPGLVDLLRAFIETRKEVAVKRLDADVQKFRVAAQRAEAVCLALEMLERVQSVLRDAFSDAEAEAALMNCMRPEDRAAIGRLPFPASHDYAKGFTLEQARHLAKKKKLAAVAPEFAKTDWMRALDEVETAKRTLSDRELVMRLVRDELRAATERFNEPRRSAPIYG